MTRLLPVAQLEIGMYVAQLDRPWLETPFLFQGFYLRDQDEIEELRAHCEHVYVSCESLSAPLPPAEPVPVSTTKCNGGKTKGRTRFSLGRLFGFGERDHAPPTDLYQTTTIYSDQRTLSEEIPAASGIHEQAVITVQGVMEGLQTSGSLDIDKLEAAVTPMVDSVLRNPAALSCLVRMQRKDDYLYHHSLASSVWATMLGRQIGLGRADLDLLALGAMLLDVGKTQLPDKVLKKPAKLNDEERTLVQRHVQFGLDILEKTGGTDPRVTEMVAHHHERYNGTGYPAGISGNDIPVFGRIAGIVDAYDAMITPRPYAELTSSYDALRKLRKLADVEFQAEIVEQFTRAIGAFPTGTLVELNTGEVAIVTRQNQIRRLRPEIMVVMDCKKKLLEDFAVIDLNEEKVSRQGELSLWIERGLPPGAHGIDPTQFYLN